MQNHSDVLKHHTTMINLKKLHGLLVQSNRKSPFSHKIEKILGQALQGKRSTIKTPPSEKKEFALKSYSRKKKPAFHRHFRKEAAFHLISEVLDETVTPKRDGQEVLKMTYSTCVFSAHGECIEYRMNRRARFHCFIKETALHGIKGILAA